MPSVPMIFLFKTIMIEGAAMEIRSVTSFENRLVMSVISLIAVMSMPCWISVIGISRVSIFKVYADMDLCGSRINGKTSGYDQTKNK
jgi:hypothetical protein